MNKNLKFDGDSFAGTNPFEFDDDPARIACKAILFAIVYALMLSLTWGPTF